MLKRTLVTAATLALVADPSLAHVGSVAHASLATGFLHPFSGADHVLAMVAVGLFAAMSGGRARLVVPVVFVCLMLTGFAASQYGISFPLVEPAILASVVVMGLLVAFARPASTSVAAGIGGTVALFHGYAHGTEIGDASMLAYSAGFSLASTALIFAGVGLFMVARKTMTGRSGWIAMRLVGAATVAGGLGLIAA